MPLLYYRNPTYWEHTNTTPKSCLSSITVVSILGTTYLLYGCRQHVQYITKLCFIILVRYEPSCINSLRKGTRAIGA